MIPAWVVEAVVTKRLEHIAGEAVDVEIDPKVHVVDMGLVTGKGIQGSSHGDSRVDAAIAVELPAVDVLVPAALELGRDDEVRRFEIGRWMNVDDNSFGIDGGIECRVCPGIDAVGSRVLERPEAGSAALRVDSVLIGMLWRRRF